MVRTYLLLSAAFLFLGVPIAATAAQMGSSPDASAKAKDITGTITKVDAIGNSLTIQKADNQEQTFKLDAATKVTVDGKPSTAANLKSGQEVTVQAEKDKALSVSAASPPTS